MKISILFLIILSKLVKLKEEERIDSNEYAIKYSEELKRDSQLLHKYNLAMPFTEEANKLMHELFYNQIGEGSIVNNQLTVVVPRKVKIGKGVTIMNGALLMAVGGITIEDNVMVAAHAKIITNNHDPFKDLF